MNAIFVFVTFLLSMPAFFLPTNRGWLRAQGWLVVFCAIFTLGLGLTVWGSTLQTRRNLGMIWGDQTPLIQSLLQQKVSFETLTRYHRLQFKGSLGDTRYQKSLLRCDTEWELTIVSLIAADTSIRLVPLLCKTTSA